MATFRIKFNRDGTLRIVRGKKSLGQGCCKGATPFKKDFELRRGEYILDGDNVHSWNSAEHIRIELVHHYHGASLIDYTSRDSTDDYIPIVCISVKLAAALNVVDGVYVLYRLDRRLVWDKQHPRA